MKQFLLSSFFMLITSMISWSQKGKVEKGYLVTRKGDTLRGFVSWKKNSDVNDKVWFSTAEEAEPIEYNWDQVEIAVKETNDDLIRVSTTKRDLEYLDKADYYIRLKDSVVTETIPLSRVYAGKLYSLYHYYDVADRYFIYDGKEMVQLLLKYRYLTPAEQKMYTDSKVPRYYVLKIYQSQLGVYYDFMKDKKLKNLLEYTEYEEKPLVNLISKMNARSK